jgi:hypothetical protein
MSDFYNILISGITGRFARALNVLADPERKRCNTSVEHGDKSEKLFAYIVGKENERIASGKAKANVP